MAGLLQGSHGRLRGDKFAFKFSQMFEYAGSVSGAFNVTGGMNDLWNGGIRPSLKEIWKGRERHPFGQCFAESCCKPQETVVGELPYIYLTGGSDDDFLGPNERLCSTFSEKGIVHEFLALVGGHDWEYWNERGRVLLESGSRHLSKPAR